MRRKLQMFLLRSGHSMVTRFGRRHALHGSIIFCSRTRRLINLRMCIGRDGTIMAFSLTKKTIVPSLSRFAIDWHGRFQTGVVAILSFPACRRTMHESEIISLSNWTIEPQPSRGKRLKLVVAMTLQSIMGARGRSRNPDCDKSNR